MTRATEKALGHVEALQQTVVRDFSGGWNVIDSDLNLSPKYSKTLYNAYRANDGTIAVRYGTTLFADLAGKVDGRIVNGYYYNGRAVVVMSSGQVALVAGDGTVTRVWDAAIASAEPGAPAGWGPTKHAVLTPFHNVLTIHNGIDKPLVVKTDLTVHYLVDEATGSNVNTPVCRYAASLPRYLVLAGDALDPGMVHISNIDSPGTFFGDPDPNDAVQLDVAPFVPLGQNAEIKGIATYRSRLVVFLDECLLFFTLGVYQGDPKVHTPQSDVGDTIQQYGAISHRSASTVDDDLLFCDLIGVPALSRSTFVSDFKPSRTSLLIDPEIQKTISRIKGVAKLEDHVWSVYNRLDKEYLLFGPGSRIGDPDEYGYAQYDYRVFVYRRVKDLDVKAWAEFGGVEFSFNCGFVSAEGRVLFGRDQRLYVYGSDREPVYADKVEPGFEGHSIAWDWELPWADFGARALLKVMRYINFDTSGDARFTARMYADNVRVDEFGNDAPVAQMRFRGGDSGGYGAEPYGDEPGFGGGRPTRRPGLYAWTVRGQLLKLRMSGNDIKPLRFVSIILLWLLGGVRR